MKSIKNILFIFFSLYLFASCDVYEQDEYEEQYVVESYLVADKYLPHVRLSTTVPAEEFYSFNETAVEDATVEIHLLREGPRSEIEETFTYQLTDPGIFHATVPHHVKPLRTYELHITLPNAAGDIRAHTTVPDTFHIIDDDMPDTYRYLSFQQPEITVSPSSYPGRQNIFVFNAISLAPEAENLTPMYRDFYEDGGQNPDDLILLANNNSGIINEGNFAVNEDGTTTIQYPWLGFSFYGINLLVANTIDDNIYDYMRSQSVQLGGSTLSPGEIQNVIYNVEGGIGVFGAVASDTTEIYLRPSVIGKE